MPKVLIAIADGIEELETAAVSDTLRRAGAEITVAAVGRQLITASRGLRIMADCLIDDSDSDFDLIVLPGGMPGAENLRNSARLRQLLVDQQTAGRPIAAICASPAVVLQRHGLLKGRRATCFPAYLELLDQPVDAPVVIDSGCVTSQGPGTAIEFALTLVELLFGSAKRAEIAAQMLAA
ncbi:MAG: Chaperone protein YajL [Deltaproteobacteria bacterium ADurb.Bin510]|nr:MAG: Chaperone protein YajL [Deltaproteobacteria bacterium ADurb.Bin510]